MMRVLRGRRLDFKAQGVLNGLQIFRVLPVYVNSRKKGLNE